MVMITKGNGRRRQHDCLQGHFALLSRPFWRPLGFEANLSSAASKNLELYL